MRTLAFVAVLAVLVPAAAGVVLAEDEPAEKPAVAPEIQKWIDDLGSDDFNVRERASQELAKKGESAREALEWAAQHEESLEARWRAQQILRRLDGQKAKPLETPEHPELEDEDEAQRLARELQKRFFGDRNPLDNPFFRDGFALGTVRAPGLALIRDMRGVRLEVTDDTKTGKDAVTTYRGESLDAILAEHPELAKHPSMDELKAKAVDPMKQLQDMFKGGRVQIFPGQGGMTSFFSSSGVQIQEGPDGATVKITERDEDGNPVVKEYKGKDLDEIKQKHPEIKDKLERSRGGMRFEVKPPQIFGRRGIPSPFERRTVTPRQSGPVMGVYVNTPSEALTVHLGLPEGHGALVKSVEPGSQAETLGIERNDIIVKVNDTPITNVDVLSRLFRAAAQNEGPLTVELIRRGKPLTVSR